MGGVAAHGSGTTRMPRRSRLTPVALTVVLLAMPSAAEAAEDTRGPGAGQPRDVSVGVYDDPIYKPPTPRQDIAGIWWAQEYRPKIEPLGGGELPFTPEGRRRYEANIAGLKDGTIKDEARRICVPDGIPRALGNPYPFQIVQTPGQVTFVYELNHMLRAATLDRPLPPPEALEIAPRYLGHSAGRWEGDTLVIESVGFNEKTFIDATGAPHSDQMKAVERIRKLNARTLEDVVTVTDPANYTKPWSARFVYDLHPEVRLEDYLCGEPHRDISRVPGVAQARRARGR